MTDELLLRRLRIGWHDDDTPIWVSDAMTEAAARIYALTADRENRLADLQIIKAERDAAYAQGYSDAETEISKSALGQKNDFLHFQYANAVNRIEVLTTERDKYEIAWMTAEGKLEDAVQGLEKCQAELDEYSRQEYPLDHSVHERYRQRDYNANPARITLAALKGETP